MLRSTSDRQLRKLVAELATRPLVDIEAIVGKLAASERQKVEALLAELQGQPALQRRPPTDDDALNTLLSPWLSAHLNAGGGKGGRPARGLTPSALLALREAAAAVRAAAVIKPLVAPARGLSRAAETWLRGRKR